MMSSDVDSSIDPWELDPDPYSIALLILGTASGIGSLLIGIGSSIREDAREHLDASESESIVRLWIHRIDKDLNRTYLAFNRLVHLLRLHESLSSDLALGEKRLYLDRPAYLLVKEDRESIAISGLSIEESLEELAALLSQKDQAIAFELSADLAENFESYRYISDVQNLLAISCGILLRIALLIEQLADSYEYRADSTVEGFREILEQLSENKGLEAST